MTLSLDIETYSSLDLYKVGMYRYTEAPDFEILLIAYSFNDEPVKVLDLTCDYDKDEMQRVERAILSSYVTKTAYNAAFERVCLSRYLGEDLDPMSWDCTMIRAAWAGLPMGLAATAKALGTEEQKSEGKALIRYFCQPCKPTKANGGRTRNLPEHDPQKWEAFISYCVQDVRTEQAIREQLAGVPGPTATEQQLFWLDQEINDRGVMVDKEMISGALAIDAEYRQRTLARAVELTGLENPNSVQQLAGWLERRTGQQVPSLTTAVVTEMLEEADDPQTREVLSLRQDLSKTSVKKYEAMEASVGSGDRIRGLLQFYGAGRTGRWAGRLVQVQNLPRNYLADLDVARQIVRGGDLATLEMLYESVPDTLSQLIRTAFVAPEGHRFIVADFSAIEARVLSWLAGERWRMEVFATHGKIYEASAAQMFKVPIEAVTKGSDLRHKGKTAELACGYGGGANALIAMGALRSGLREEDLPGIISSWRRANPAIVRYWKAVEAAAIEAVETGARTKARWAAFSIHGKDLLLTLPSGRNLVYTHVSLAPGNFGSPQIRFKGVDSVTKQWKTLTTYGGKLVENICQAVARDCLAEAMLRLDAAGYRIVMHVHDEVVLEVPEGKGSMEEVNEIMGQPIQWAKGLVLTADSFETKYYQKD